MKQTNGQATDYGRQYGMQMGLDLAQQPAMSKWIMKFETLQQNMQGWVLLGLSQLWTLKVLQCEGFLWRSGEMSSYKDGIQISTSNRTWCQSQTTHKWAVTKGIILDLTLFTTEQGKKNLSCWNRQLWNVNTINKINKATYTSLQWQAVATAAFMLKSAVITFVGHTFNQAN